ncbi:MAG: Gfo/Idh/MocA family oxidoreductase [Armatimonadetes bacterium]|nr:Gfo/Idh/MocA family oxidoreductase [Armatimonadota bacterium]
MGSYGFGVIGCGVICDTHIKAIKELDNAHLVAVCDTRQDAAQAKARKWGCAWYTDLDQLLARDDIHVVNVVVPSGLHARLGIQAAEAGKHVICTKPIDITLEAIDALIAAGERNGVLIGATHQCRDYRIYRRVKQAVDDGLLGRLLYGNVRVPWYRSDEYYSDGWHGTRALDGGGALMNQSIHYIDLLLWMMGEVEAVCGFAGTLDHQIEVEDCATAALLFRGGSQGMVQGTTCTYRGYEARLGLHGTRGNVVIVGDELQLWDVEGDEIVHNPSAGHTGGAADPKMGMVGESVAAHARQIGDLLRAIEEGRQPELNAREARRAVEVILAIYKASESRSYVTLPL